MPFTLDFTEHRSIMSARPLDLPRQNRVQNQPLRAFARKIHVDPSQSAIEPLLCAAQHEVVLRMAAVPSLSQRSCSLRQYVSITRRVGPFQHVEQYVGAPALEQRVDLVVEAHFARRGVTLMRANVSDQCVEHCLSLSLGNHAHRQRDGLCGLAAFVVAMLRSIEELRVEVVANARCLICVRRAVLVSAQHCGGFLQSFQILVVDRRPRHARRRQL